MKLSRKTWNQGNLEQNTFAMRRRATHQVRIDEPAVALFARVCLAETPGWLPLGSLSLSSPANGRGLWSEGETSSIVLQQPGQSFWTMTEVEPEALHGQAVVLHPELAVGTLEVTIEEHGQGSELRFDLSYTALSEAGSALFQNGIDRRLNQLLESFGENLASSSAEPATPVATISYQPRSLAVEHEGIIDGGIEECFTLACPVAELLWIDDWHFDLIYSESGRNEIGCTFLEPSTGLSILRSAGANTYWYTTRHDSEQHQFNAVWLTRDLTMAYWQVSMTEHGGQTRVSWSLSYSALGAEGGRLLGEAGMETRMKRALSFLATSLKHYVETGSIYRISSRRKMQIVASLIGAALGRHLRQRTGAAA